MELRNRVAIVTGGGGPGTGRAICLRLARAGASVVVVDIDDEGGAETVDRINGRGAFMHADVTIEKDVRRMVCSAEKSFGRLDILINNAGRTQPPYFPEASVEHWSTSISTCAVPCSRFSSRSSR